MIYAGSPRRRVAGDALVADAIRAGQKNAHPEPQRSEDMRSRLRRRDRSGRRERMLATGRVAFGLALSGLALSYVSFDSYENASDAEVRRASVAVVFTGAFARVDAGLRLLAEGAAPRLFISGANAGAGIAPARFVDQFSPRNPDISDLRRWVACCVAFGKHANNTFENALETACWLERRAVKGPVLLITTRSHMARAVATLSAAAPEYPLVAYPVDDEIAPPGDPRGRTLEYLKYIATLATISVSSWAIAPLLPGFLSWASGWDCARDPH